ncbi:leucine--tRNA ligase [Amycolatopsis cihanbeyliensis]|uniref:Leucine--tRNA ligase n=1 Tax=Amycolatopsis cihanbeyliensis TaxID=1128664 RepID=A0A542DNG6_AMYCI|nr:leucine--tRNA ligase [Amycolatopsis cihanbeyliensis]TQJ04651.1 leucyl-tRNA synthetase [Amycolatopsis cihanbeyliensis]
MEKHSTPAGRERWVRAWAEDGVFEADHQDTERPRRMVVSMFPYPSGDLHMGHAEAYSISDTVARYRRMCGDNVLNPIGWDSFGLPAENAALKRNLDPREWTYANIDVQAESFRDFGISFDWRARLHTSDPEYYRWNQWIFLRMFERGLAYRKAAPVNWCSKDETVLANEQVIQGRCERCGTVVERRNLTQWFFRITAYAQRLLDDMEQLSGSWPEQVLLMQRNWIGRSEGAYIDFSVNESDETIRVFSTRPDTLYGASFIVIASDSDLADRICQQDRKAELDSYREQIGSATDIERLAADRPMTGVFIGRYAVNPLTGESLPIYVSDYVLAEYGTGAIMAVPAHDQRDLRFAQEKHLPIRVVIDSPHDPESTGTAYEGDGTVVNSGEFTDLPSDEAQSQIIAELERRGAGEGTVTYRLRDWLLSRQRYWGTPIPIIHCPSCGEVPVPDDDLPVELPQSGYQLRPGGGKAPLESATEWVNVDCPRCGQAAKRDTDTMDTFVDSSWYPLRYVNPHYTDGPFDPAAVEKWLPVDIYVGGIEHAILHLLYARFFTKVFHDLGLVSFVEPFTSLINQGQVIMNGKAMSKSLGNLVNLQEQIAAYGPDAVRITMLFAGPPEDDIDWADVSASGSVKWLGRVQRVVADATAFSSSRHAAEEDTDLRRDIHRLISEATEAMERYRFNVAIARLMSLTSRLRKALDSGAHAREVVLEGTNALVTMLSCFAPFAAADAWDTLGNPPYVEHAPWPRADDDLLAGELVTAVIQVSGKVRDRIQVPANINEEELRERALASERVIKAGQGAEIKKVIVRAPKLVNIVFS